MPPTRRVLFTYLASDTFQNLVRWSNWFSKMLPFGLKDHRHVVEGVVVKNHRYIAEGVVIIHRDDFHHVLDYKHFSPVTDRATLLRGFVGSIGIKEETFDLYVTDTKNPYDFRVVVSDIAGDELMVQRFDETVTFNGKCKGWYSNRIDCTQCEDKIMSFLLFSLLQETNRVQGMPEIEVKA